MKHYFYSHHKSEKAQNRESILLILIIDKNLNTVKEPSKNQPTPGVVWEMECLLFFFFFTLKLHHRGHIYFHWIDENNLFSTSSFRLNTPFIMNLKKSSSIVQIVLTDLGE